MTTQLMRRCKAVALLTRYTNRGKLSIDIEAEIVRSAHEFTDYEAKVRQLAYNLKKSPGLIDQYSVEQLVRLDDETMSKDTDVSDWVHQYSAEIAKEKELMNQTPISAQTSILKCRKCGGSNLSTNQVQTRGADESMTVFVECNTCSTRWKC